MKDEEISLKVIREKIQEKSATWKAGKTSISELSPAERKRRLGILPTDKQRAAITKLGLDREQSSRYLERSKDTKSGPRSIGSKQVGFNNKIDWRDIDGTDFTTSIKDQGSCGSCVAFGTIASLEALLKIRYYKDPDIDINLSEAHLLWCGGGSCDGWNMDEACDYLEKNGVPTEECFPYDDTPKSCQDTCSDWESQIDHTKILDWNNIVDINTMKSNIVDNGPQITGMAVYTDFFYYKSGIYHHTVGVLEGYHCICVVGFDDDDECWICKNSWGTNWGESGFFKIGYNECGIKDVFGMWNITIETVEEEEGDAESVAIEYPFISTDGTMYANIANKELRKQVSKTDLIGIAELLMGSTNIHVKWSGEEIISIKCIKKY
jgi:C1A family cysteine protease